MVVLCMYVIQVLLYALTLWIAKEKTPKNTQYKKVAVLIACRNEENNILSCLQSLYAQNYPIEHFEVWIGDDDSTDNTAQVIQDFIQDKPNFHYVKITQGIANLKAKQNVLAQLFHKTNAEIILITDADIITPHTWIDTMTSAFEYDKTGIVCGTTYILPKGFFSTLQSIDWLFYMGIAKANLDLGMPITAVGNNMGVRKSAYTQIGGYETIGFSITEDYKLFKEILNGTEHTAKWIFRAENTNITYGIPSLLKWLQQRKRWLKGGKELPLKVWLLMLFNVFTELFMFASMIQEIDFFLVLLFVKTIVNAIFLIVIFTKLHTWNRNWIWSVLLYSLYQMWLIPVLFLYFLFPSKIKWKEREY
jgi:cellulose synthase/poly-beta-1,6-N-acetylglucosamine synthase-like glycosyltransferase